MTSHTTFAFAMRTLREQPLATVDAAEVGARINELLGLPPSAGFVPRSIKAIGDLFRYPDESFGERLAEGLSVFRGETEASQALERFAEGIVVLGRATQQATYTGTFDVAPACSPYLGAHLFGAETPERVRLMIRLRDCYRRGGIDGDSIELPDHVAEVLSLAERYEDDEWLDLGRQVFEPALATMSALLAPTSNPYRHLVAAARHLAAEAFGAA